MSYGQKSYKSLQIPQIEDLYDLKKICTISREATKKT